MDAVKSGSNGSTSFLPPYFKLLKHTRSKEGYLYNAPASFLVRSFTRLGKWACSYCLLFAIKTNISKKTWNGSQRASYYTVLSLHWSLKVKSAKFKMLMILNIAWGECVAACAACLLKALWVDSWQGQEWYRQTKCLNLSLRIGFVILKSNPYWMYRTSEVIER